MTLPDTNAIIRKYLANNAGIMAFFAPGTPRVYCPRLPEKAILPAIGFFTRGGRSNPYIPDIPEPSVQIDCWASDKEIGGIIVAGSVIARSLYQTLYDALQGIQNVKVTIGGINFYILGAQEEVQGQDLVDIDIPGYFRVLTYFSIMIR